MRCTSAVAPDLGPRLLQQQKSVLRLGKKSRLALWLLVFFIEVSNVVLLAVWAGMYFTHRTRGSFLWVIKVYFLFNQAFQFLEHYGFYIASGYTLLCTIFLNRVFRLLVVSIRHRELRFGISSFQPAAAAETISSPFRKVFKNIRRSIERIQYLLGVHGPYFETRLLIDDVIELAFQSFAAHASSRSISNEALNQVYGVVILLNSISTLAFKRVFHSPENLVKQRVARLLTDLVLDFVWGTLLPIWMYQPILKAYFIQLDHGNSVDFTENSAREVERVLVVSWWNYVMSIVPFCTSLLNLVEVRSLLREEFTLQNVRHNRIKSTFVSFQANLSEYRFGGQERISPRLIVAVHSLITLTGIGIFVASLSASDLFGTHTHATLVGCMHRVYPWLTTKEACIGRIIDCNILKVDGSHDQIETVLQTLDASTLADLFITNCKVLNLSVPTLHNFRRLQSLIITNSAVVDWDTEVAALSTKAMPDLRTVKLVSVTFDAQLETIALFSTELSQTTEWIHIQDTNMSEALIRDDLVADNWKNLIYLDCDNCSLTAFPLRVVTSMPRLLMLSLVNNDIYDFPDDWPSPSMTLVMLWVDGNTHLTGISDALWRQGAILQSVFMQDTSVASIPGWLEETAKTNLVLKIYAFGTPLCERNTSVELPHFVSCLYQDI